MAEWVAQGPDFARDGVVRWRCVDLQQRISRNLLLNCTSARSANCCSATIWIRARVNQDEGCEPRVWMIVAVLAGVQF